MHVTGSLRGKIAYQTYHILWIHQIECLRGINVHGWGWNNKFTLSWICWTEMNHSDLDSWSTKLVKGHCIPCYQWAFCWGSWRITEQWGGEREKLPPDIDFTHSVLRPSSLIYKKRPGSRSHTAHPLSTVTSCVKKEIMLWTIETEQTKRWQKDHYKAHVEWHSHK